MSAVLIMSRAPRPGEAKTRLQPLLGRAGAARLQAELVRHTAGWAAGAAPTWLAFTPADAEPELAALVPAGVARFAQCGGDLGARMRAASGYVLARAGGPVAVVGTDAPLLGAEHLTAAEAELARGHDVCIVPAHDGGYALIMLAGDLPAAFDLPATAWGGPQVLELTRRALGGAGLRLATLAAVSDLDTPADARALREDPRCPAAIRQALTPESVRA
jgi:hypothetical protein